jgi:intergrase/recombinase
VVKIRIHKLKKIKTYQLRTFLIHASSEYIEKERKGIEDGSDYSAFVSDDDFIGDLLEVQESDIKKEKGEKIYLSSLDKIVEIVEVVHNMDDVVCVVNEAQIVETEHAEKARLHTLNKIDMLIESKQATEASDKAFREMMLHRQRNAEKNFWERLIGRG